MTHRDGLPRFSARSVRRGDAGHRKACATPSESLGKAPSRSRRRPVGGRRKVLTMPPHRRHLSSCPTSRLRDLYESGSAPLGMIPISTIGMGTGPFFLAFCVALVYDCRDRDRYMFGGQIHGS